MKKKEKLRKEFLHIRNGFQEQKIIKISNEIKDLFFSLQYLNNNNKFLLYHSFGKEINTHGIIDNLYEKEKEVYLPYVDKNRRELMISKVNKDDPLLPGVFGIKEPADKQNIPVREMELIVVPGLIFDKKGYRIGYGGGYYDRLLKNINKNTITIGVCFEEFLLESIPIEKYDIPV